jgi:hypothetical protein
MRSVSKLRTFAGDPMRLASIVLLFGGLIQGCANPCQQICGRMASYAQEDCGYTVSDAELDACVDQQSSPESETLSVCRDYGDLETIRRQWSCDDLDAYWGTGGDVVASTPTTSE